MDDQLRHYGRWLSRLGHALVLVTALVIILPSAIGLMRAADFGLALGPILIRAAVIWLPAIFYLLAVGFLAGAFGQVGKGSLFGPAVARGCTRAGVALAIGALLSAIGVPNALRILHEQGVLPRGPSGLAGLVSFDLAYLAVGVVGIALVLLGSLLRRAAALQAHARALEEEVEGFF